MSLLTGIGKVLGERTLLKLKMLKNRENGVSPVVAVMLMLVVTIVVAAVVTVFATGIVGSVEEAPVAVLTAVVDSSWSE